MKDTTELTRPKPTVNDIARVAGVSLATVDRVLNARPGVRDVTIEKVNKAIAELGVCAGYGRGQTSPDAANID